jgi:hypothetical protein
MSHRSKDGAALASLAIYSEGEESLLVHADYLIGSGTLCLCYTHTHSWTAVDKSTIQYHAKELLLQLYKYKQIVFKKISSF